MYSFPQACSWHTLDGRTVDGVHKGKGPRPVDPDAGAGAFEPTESSSQTTASLIFSAVLCCVCACIPSPPCSLCCRRALYAACWLALVATAWYGMLELIHAAVCVPTHILIWPLSLFTLRMLCAAVAAAAEAATAQEDEIMGDTIDMLEAQLSELLLQGASIDESCRADRAHD